MCNSKKWLVCRVDPETSEPLMRQLCNSLNEAISVVRTLGCNCIIAEVSQVLVCNVVDNKIFIQ